MLAALRDVFSAARHDEPYVSLVNIDKDDANAAATGAALAHVLSRPDSIRQRAQNAATISSAFAAALVIAGVSQLAGGSESYRDWTIALMFSALAAWAVSVGLFIYAVTFIDKETSSPTGYSELVRDYERYADKVRAKTRLAASVAACALLLTVAAVCSELIERITPSDKRMQLLLTPEGADVVDKLCEWPSDHKADRRLVTGMLPRDELTRSAVQIKDPSLGEDAASPKCVEQGDVRVPRAAVQGAVELQ